MAEHRLVTLAVEKGYITSEQKVEALKEQKALSDRGLERNLLFVLQDLGHLSDEHLNKLRVLTSSAHYNALEVDGYLIIKRIGKGGMGEIFLGRNDNGEEAAIKLLPSKLTKQKDYVQRFKREMSLLGKLNHINITKFISSGVIEERIFFIMELVKGRNLKEVVVEDGPISVANAITIIKQTASALSHAWSYGIIHRDIKPSNILIKQSENDFDAEEEVISKICDFGLAKAKPFLEEKTEDLTKAGMAVGTPHYMSPEAATGSDIIDPRIDIYSFGATIYHALVGETLYSGKNSAIIMYKQATEEIDARTLAIDKLPNEIRVLLAKMLCKDIDERIGTWDEVLLETERISIEKMEREITSTFVKKTSKKNEKKQKALSLIRLSIILIAIIFFVSAIILIIINLTDTSIYLSANPKTFLETKNKARALAKNKTVIIELEEGVYNAPWWFNKKDSNIQIKAKQNAIKLINHEQNPLSILIEDNVKNFFISGVKCSYNTDNTQSQPGACIKIENNCSVILKDIEIKNSNSRAISIENSKVKLDNIIIKNCKLGISCKEKGDVSINSSIINTKQYALTSSSTNLSIKNSLIESTTNGIDFTISLNEGKANFNNCIINSQTSGIYFNYLKEINLDNISINSSNKNIHFNEPKKINIQNISLQSNKTAIFWNGPWYNLNIVENINSNAPNKLTNTDLTEFQNEGVGANKQYLKNIPNLIE